MKIKVSKDFIEQYKKADIRIKHSIDEKLRLFSKNSKDLSLRNHKLREPYAGKRSIDINADWRAIYEEILDDPKEPVAYFIVLGTHKKLYPTNSR
jgi:addiction module RelE/StbE family toxin